jgi:hypothetical protein
MEPLTITDAATDEASFVKEFCVPFLLGAQNEDGGWGFYPNSESRVEPTCWALRALQNSSVHVVEDHLRSAQQYLLLAQLRDGSWPAAPEQKTGSSVTSLACSVLSPDKDCKSSVSAGLEWLCQDYPRDSAPWRRFFQKFHPKSRVADHDDSFRGWGWTPRTSSWVEPSAFAIQALRDCPSEWRPAESAQRLELAVGVLYDRMCPKGGWNCGNPRVYGVDGEPLVLPTGWALLALHDQPACERKSKSLAWLHASIASIHGPASLAVARITLEAYAIELPEVNHKLQNLFDAREFLRTTEVVSWTCLALSPKRYWFPPAECAH